MSQPTAYIEIEKITSDRQEAVFFEGYAWDTDKETYHAFNDAKARLAVKFEQAEYLVDLYSDPNELIETFPLSELGYRSLTRPEKRPVS